MAHLPILCNQCKDKSNLVTEQNGVSLRYSILENVQLVLALHKSCAEAWCLEFGMPLPAGNSLN